MRNKKIATLCAAMAAALVLAFGAKVYAGDPESSQKHFKDGTRLFKDKDWAGALKEFRQSFELNPHWKIRVNIASCYIHLELLDDAMMELSFAVEESEGKMKPELVALVEQNMAMLEKQLVSLKMDTPVGGDLTLFVDDEQIARLAKEGIVYLEPGEHTVEVKYLGKRILLETYDLAAPGMQQAVTVEEVLPEEALPPKPKTLKERWEIWTGLSLFVAGGAMVGGFGYLAEKTADYNKTLREARYNTISSMDVCDCYALTGSDLADCTTTLPSEAYRQEVLDICDQKESLTAGQISLSVIGFASVITGLGFMLHDLVKNRKKASSAALETKKKLSVGVTPIFGARVYGLSLGGTF
jgi:hypothetical protein